MIELFLAGLWPLIWHMSAATLAMIACAAVAWFSPGLRNIAIYAGVTIFLTTTAYVVGVTDEKRRWDATIAVDKTQANKAGTAADGICDTSECVRNDPNNRDR
jgi:hypothetical protein